MAHIIELTTITMTNKNKQPGHTYTIDSYTDLDFVSRSYEFVCALNAALAFNIFEIIEKGEHVSTEHSKLLSVLIAWGLIFWDRKNCRYRTAAIVQKHLLKNAPYPLHSWFQWNLEHESVNWFQYAHGQIPEGEAYEKWSQEKYELFHQAMDEKGKYFSNRMIAVLKEHDYTPLFKIVVDIAAGSAIHGANLLRECPQMKKIVINDFDLRRARQTIASLPEPLSSKADLREESMLDLELTSIDTAMLGYIIGDLDDATVRALLERLRTARVRHIIVLDYLKQNENSERYDLMSNLALGARSPLLTPAELCTRFSEFDYRVQIQEHLEDDHFLTVFRLG